MVVEVKEDRLPDRTGKIPGAGGSRAMGSVCRKEGTSTRENRFHFKRRKRAAVVESREERANERSKRASEKRNSRNLGTRSRPLERKGEKPAELHLVTKIRIKGRSGRTAARAITGTTTVSEDGCAEL